MDGLAQHHLLSFRGLDDLVHADTMLFILGLTVAGVRDRQTRLLEGITFFMLRRNNGAILPTVVASRRSWRWRRGSQRRLDDRADDPDAGHHPDARRGAGVCHPLRGHGVHGGSRRSAESGWPTESHPI
jgi:hypothetical protein